jgi:hypothetical protein
MLYHHGHSNDMISAVPMQFGVHRVLEATQGSHISQMGQIGMSSPLQPLQVPAHLALGFHLQCSLSTACFEVSVMMSYRCGNRSGCSLVPGGVPCRAADDPAAEGWPAADAGSPEDSGQVWAHRSLSRPGALCTCLAAANIESNSIAFHLLMSENMFTVPELHAPEA